MSCVHQESSSSRESHITSPPSICKHGPPTSLIHGYYSSMVKIGGQKSRSHHAQNTKYLYEYTKLV